VTERRVLYVNHTARVSGAERSLLDLLAALPSAVVPVVSTPEGDLAERVRALGVPTVALAAVDAGLRPHPVQTPRALAGMLRASRQVAHAARRMGADVVHANSVRAGMVAVLAARQGAPAPVVHVRDCLPAGPVTARVRALVDGGAAAVVANSTHTARRWGGRRDVDVVYSPVDVSRFDPALVDRAAARAALGVAAGDHPVLAVVGQITPWKGQDDAVRAAALLRQEWPGLRLLVVGDVEFDAPGTRHDNRAYAESLRALVDESGMRERVSFLGRREDVPAVLAGVDVLLVPSWEEPMGRTVIEGMAMGVCVVATSAGGPAELVEHGRTGYLARPRRPQEWADTVRAHLRRGEEAAGMAAAARASALARDVGHHVNGVLAVYDRITGTAR
jgi:L-malate glycosyltransferase